MAKRIRGHEPVNCVLTKMIGWIYAIGLGFVFVFHLPRYWREKRLRGVWREYLGHPPSVSAAGGEGDRIWIHAVSAGEMRLAIRLTAEWRRQAAQANEPKDLRFVLTTGTPAGKAAARDALELGDIVTYAPLDFEQSVRRFLSWAKPRLCVILETEIWPNRLAALYRSGIPVCVVNARLSDKAFPSYRRFRAFFRYSLAGLERVFAQSAEHAARFAEIGVPASRIEVCGNMKFDLVANPEGRTEVFFGAGSGRRFPVVLAASTHAGEEEALLNAFEGLRGRHPLACLVIAPRHLSRLESVASLLNARRVSWVRWSARPAVAGECAVVLVDQWGILNLFYSEADMIYVGGSMVPIGGHNPVEPAVFGKPVFYGPHMHNFKDVDGEFVKAGAVIRLRGRDELESVLSRLASDPGLRRDLGVKAAQVVSQNRGAVSRTTARLRAIMNQNSEDGQHVSLG